MPRASGDGRHYRLGTWKRAASQRQGEVPHTCRFSTPSRLLKALGPPHLPSSCQVSGLSFCHCRSHIHLLHLCLCPLPIFSKLPSSTITAFSQISKSPALSSRLVALSPLFVLCLPRLSLRICIAQVGPLRLSRPFSPSILCVFFLFPSLSRISHPSSRASTTLGDFVACFEGTP